MLQCHWLLIAEHAALAANTRSSSPSINRPQNTMQLHIVEVGTAQPLQHKKSVPAMQSVLVRAIKPTGAENAMPATCTNNAG
jgi:hypothetical protein